MAFSPGGELILTPFHRMRLLSFLLTPDTLRAALPHLLGGAVCLRMEAM